jgi:hypothetical protein
LLLRTVRRNSTPSVDDYHAMLKHVCAPRPSERVLGFVAVFIASFGMALFGVGGRTLVGGVVVGSLLIVVKGLRTQHRLRPRPGGALLCRYDVQLTEGGVHLRTRHWTSHVTWHGVLAVEEAAAHWFLRIDTASVYTVPKRSFPNGEAMQQFVDFARNGVSRAQVTENTVA